MPPHDTIPRSPVYMSYIYQHQNIPVPSPERAASPYRPATGLTRSDLDFEGARGAWLRCRALPLRNGMQQGTL